MCAIHTQEKRTRTTGWTRRLIHRATKHEIAKKDRCKKALHARTPGRNRCRSCLIQMDNIDRTMQKEGRAEPSHMPFLSQRGSGSMRWKQGCGLTRSPVLPGCSRGWILVLRSKVSREMGRHTEQKNISIPNTSTCKQARMVTRNILVETMQFRL